MVATPLRTEITTSTGTHLTTPTKDSVTIVREGLMKLYEVYRASNGLAQHPRVLDSKAREVSEFFRGHGITKHQILDGFLAIKACVPPLPDPNHAPLTRVTHLCGWLMGFSGILEDPTWWESAARLEPEYNPWPEFAGKPMNTDGKAPAVSVEEVAREIAIAPSRQPAKEELSTEPHSNDPYDLINSNPKSFLDNMGSVEKQHFLVVEDLVNGAPAILGILAGCLRQSFARLEARRSEDKPEVNIVDLTGEPYLGMEQDKSNPYFRVFYADVCDRPMASTLSEDERWHLPIMEGIWQASNALKERLRKKKFTNHTVEFPPHFLVLRRWNAILSGWSDLTSEQKKSLNATWRETYDHPEDQSIDVRKAVKEILTLGDAVNVVVVMSITCFGSVADVGVRENELNSFLIVIPGTASTSNGDKAIRGAISDKRFQFVDADNRSVLKAALLQGRMFSLSTGHQYCLTNLDNGMIMSIPTIVEVSGKKLAIEQVQYGMILKKFKPSGLLNG